MRSTLPLAMLACATMSCANDPAATARESTPPGATAASVAPSDPPVTAVPPAPVTPELIDAVTAAPDDPAARRRLAIALHAAQRRDEALVHFEKLVELQPDGRSLLELALAYASVSRPRDAETTYGRLLALEPNHPIALHNLGNLALGRGDATAATEHYRKALALKPDYLLARGHLGDALKQLGRYEEAYRSYEAVLEMEPANAQELSAFDDALYQMALLDLEMGATQRAAEILSQLVQSVPDHPHAHYAFSRALTALGRLDEARQAMATHMQLMAAQAPSGAVAAGDAP